MFFQVNRMDLFQFIGNIAQLEWKWKRNGEREGCIGEYFQTTNSPISGYHGRGSGDWSRTSWPTIQQGGKPYH